MYCSEGNPSEVYRMRKEKDLDLFQARAKWGNPSYFEEIHDRGLKINYGEVINDRTLTLEYQVDGNVIKTEEIGAGQSTTILNPTDYSIKKGYDNLFQDLI